jgi:hypothetical protein
MVGNIIDGPNSLSNRIVRALNVGADRDTLHEILVVEEKVATEEEFFLAFVTAEIRFGDLEKSAGRS